MIRILGAGVAGLTVATELVAQGADVEICDPNGVPGAHGCSWWAGGMLAPWCEYENAEEPVVRLGQSAIDWWARYTEVSIHGTLVVAHPRDLPDLKRFARKTSEFSWVNSDGISTLEPDLHGFDTGLYFPREAHLAPRDALHALVRNLEGKGISIGQSASHKYVETTVDCRGFAARDELPDLRGVKGEMIILRAPDIHITRPVRLLHPRIPLYIVPRGNGIYMLGATMVESEAASHITARSMLELLSAAYALSPAFGEAEILETGVDLRPAFADNLPRIRRRGTTIFANGLYRHGYLLAPALAKGIAELILDDRKSEFVDEDYCER